MKLLNVIYVMLSVLVLTACTEEAHPEKVDVEVEPENNVSPKMNAEGLELLEDPEPIRKGTATGYLGFIDHYLEVYDTVLNSRALLIDRFGNKRTFKIALQRRQDVFLRDSSAQAPVGKIWHYEYTDSAQLANVLRNWFLEFGNNRSEIKPGVNQMVHSESGVFVINELSIDVFLVECIYYDEFSWNDKKESFRQAVINESSTVFRVDCDGELIWEQYSLPEEEVDEAETNKDADEDVGEDESP